jgi:integrase
MDHLAGITDAKGAAKYTGLHALRHFYASWCINRRADASFCCIRMMLSGVLTMRE